MYTCYECRSTNFEKCRGFLYCAVCHVQHPDYIEQAVDQSSMTYAKVLSQSKVKKEIPVLKKNWVSWEAYNYILLGFVKDLLATGLAPVKLNSNTLSVWIGYLDSCGLNYKSADMKNKLRKRPCHKLKQEKDSGKTMDEVRKNEFLQGAVSNSNILPAQRIMKNVYKKHKKFLNSQSTQACDSYVEDVFEDLGSPFHKYGSQKEFFNSNQATINSSFPQTSRVSDKTRKSFTTKKVMKMSKGRLLGILHIALLFERSDVHLSDLIRFIREAHLSYAKITHFLPQEIKVTKGDSGYLETLHSDSMPKHAQQRILGAEVARILKIVEFPFPNMKSLISRYCKDLNLPDEFIDRALVISKMTSVKDLCSFRKLKHEIPNYEGMAASCLIYVMKILFGLDDQTEFLLSDIAEKTNRLLNSQEDVFLFSFREWQKFIELRKTLLKEVHYPTEEKHGRTDLISSSGLIDMILKESKDIYREERFTAYRDYFMDPELMKTCRDVLNTLSKSKTEFKMDFPPSLTPLSSYLHSILKGYEERIKNRTPQDACLPQLDPTTLNMLRVNYKYHDVSYPFDLKKYKELIIKNGFTLKYISRRKQYKIDKDDDDDDGNGYSYRREAMDEEEENEVSLSKLTLGSGANDFDSTKNLESIPSKRKRIQASAWSKIDYVELSSSSDVYFIEDMTLTWKLRSPKLDDTLEVSFLSEVFEKTPINFQWLVREFSFLLEMTERDIYLQLYRLENAIRKAIALPLSDFEVRNRIA